ncbi:MAG: phosphoenolpyruvate kinase [Planctomycetota bacterium]
MKTSLSNEAVRGIAARLQDANLAFNKYYPGESGTRQPVHTVYGGAHLFSYDSARKLGELAIRSLDENAPDFVVFGKAIGLPGADKLPSTLAETNALAVALKKDTELARKANPAAWMSYTIYGRVLEKIKRQAVEDFRIDFEDGYGNRPDAEEDGHAEQAAREVARGHKEGTLPPFIGIRIKPFTEELRARSFRTLDIFVSTLAAECGKTLPSNFVVTIPKVVIPEQVAALVELFEVIEKQTGLAAGSLKLEFMVEMTQSILNSRGESTLPLILQAARGRCTGAHFGTYDYTASCNITAAYQHMAHAACDFAKHNMQVALGGTGIYLSDGATNIMPIGPHRAEKGGPPLTWQQQQENRAVVHRSWKLHYDHVRHSLENAYFQGWDLHPAQLPTRYAAVYAFFLESLDAASERLKNFINKAAQATLVGDVFDDAATGQGLLNYFLRGINSGALTEAEALATGITVDELRGRSFVKILKNRRGG